MTQLNPTPSLSRATLLIALTFIAFLMTTTVAKAASHKVIMKSISYDPKKLTVKSGDTVVWSNESYTPHSATSDDQASEAKSGAAIPEAFDTGLIDPKKTTKPVKFTKSGLYHYHCSLHGQSMSGMIEVQP